MICRQPTKLSIIKAVCRFLMPGESGQLTQDLWIWRAPETYRGVGARSDELNAIPRRTHWDRVHEGPLHSAVRLLGRLSNIRKHIFG